VATAPVAESELLNAKKQALGYLLNMARLGRSPALYAELAVEQVSLQGDAITATLIQELMAAPDFETWFPSIERLDPTLVRQRPWFSEFFEVIREIIAGRNQPEEGEPVEAKA
jgi:hypothetical protein